MTEHSQARPKYRTTVRSINEGQYTLDVRTGATGTIDEWVDRFAYGWAAPVDRLEDLLSLLHEDIVLEAPTIPPRSKGKQEARNAFLNAFRMFPTLTGAVHRHCWLDDVLFIEWSQSARIGKKDLTWRMVDRFLFRDGVAVERIAFFDALRIRNAIMSSPAAILQYLRFRRG